MAISTLVLLISIKNKKFSYSDLIFIFILSLAPMFQMSNYYEIRDSYNFYETQERFAINHDLILSKDISDYLDEARTSHPSKIKKVNIKIKNQELITGAEFLVVTYLADVCLIPEDNKDLFDALEVYPAKKSVLKNIITQKMLDSDDCFREIERFTK